MVNNNVFYFFAGILMWNVASSHSTSESCDLYQRYSLDHTICRNPAPDCEILTSGVSRSNRDRIVQLHNEYRSKIATGTGEGIDLPKASDMMQMEWDEELAEIAQAHASQCRFGHDCMQCRKTTDYNVGQNIYKRTIHERISQYPGENWKAVVKAWFMEIENFHEKCVECFDPKKNNGTSHHFTQLVAAKSWLVGCGYTLFMEDDSVHQIMVCNYGPEGSGLHEPVYTPGEPCSTCPTNSLCFASHDPSDETGPPCRDSECYDGLCRLDANEFYPRYPRESDSTVFECDLDHLGKSCKVSSPSGQASWKRTPSRTGTYLGVTLKPGEMSTLNFTNVVPLGNVQKNCLCIDFRKGPTKYSPPDEQSDTEVYMHFLMTEEEINFVREIHEDTPDFKPHCEELEFSTPVKLSVSFKVRPDASKQHYFEMRNIHAKSEACPEMNAENDDPIGS